MLTYFDHHEFWHVHISAIFPIPLVQNHLHQAICNLERITSAEWISIYLLVSRIEERINFFSTISKIYNSLLPVHNYLATFKSNYQNKYEYATYLTCQNRLYSVMNQWHLVWFGNAQKYTAIVGLCLIDEKFVYHKRCYFSQKMLFFLFTIHIILSLYWPASPTIHINIRVASGFEFSVCLFVCL